MNNNTKINAGLYMRVSTEDQAREGFSLPKQKERLEAYCKFNDYNIVEYYKDAGISAKTGNHRPEYERMLEDGENGKRNMFIALKLDRVTRSVKDWESLIEFWKNKFEKLIDFLHGKIHNWFDKDDKYLDVVYDMYQDNVLDDDDINYLDLNKEKDDFEI